jgi:ferric-dicitrate binding protein FerR (iron transport regulator)
VLTTDGIAVCVRADAARPPFALRHCASARRIDMGWLIGDCVLDDRDCGRFGSELALVVRSGFNQEISTRRSPAEPVVVASSYDRLFELSPQPPRLLLTSGSRAAKLRRMPSRALGPTLKILLLAAASVAVLLSACAKPAPQEVRLPDGTQVILLNGTRAIPAIGFPQNREIQLEGNGQVFIKARQQTKPLTVRTGLLILTVDGDTAFRALVSSEKIGEQAEVLYGHVRAAKAYPSNFADPDDLAAGEMSMINKSIDLMEKEKFDPSELARWSKDVTAAAEHPVGGTP